MAKQTDTAIAIVPIEKYVLTTMIQSGELSLKEMINENLGEEGLSISDLERVIVPAGGSTVWSIPTADGDENSEVFDAVIVHHQTQRTYWEDPNSSGAPPDCFSPDAKIGNVYGNCSTCQFAQYGSAENKSAQACKLKRVLFLLRPDSILPVVLNVPPASLKDIKKYLVKLIGVNKKTFDVVTRMTLTKEKNAQGQVFSKAHFELLKTEKNADVIAYAKAMKPVLTQESFVPEPDFVQTEPNNNPAE